MSYNDHYIYPPLNYMAPDPYRTTYLPHHNFHHKDAPFPHFRRSISHAFGVATHPLGHEHVPHIPAVDVRESATRYYLDVELPGVDSGDNVKIRWINSRTLLVEGQADRPILEEEAKGAALERFKTRGDEIGADESGKEIGGEQTVFLTMHERKTGKFSRALTFATDVDHKTLEARLHGGLLLLMIPKKESEIAGLEHKEIVVKSAVEGQDGRKSSAASGPAAWPGLNPSVDIEEFKKTHETGEPAAFPGLNPV